jgi:glutaminyl-peptide cyclotransferase
VFKHNRVSGIAKSCGPGLFTIALLCVACCSCLSEDIKPAPATLQPAPAIPQPVPVYSYKVVNTFPHDRQAFTQGLALDNGILYEGTGGYGRSALRRVDLETGRVLQEYKLPGKYFGEGITVCKNTLVQLTWRSNTGFVYDADSFKLLREFSYPTEGWGVTYDGDRIIMSDGTASLYFLDPETLKTTGDLQVHDDNGPVEMLNELEYVNGSIYANVWRTDKIAIIDPGNGSVTGWIDLAGLLDKGQFGSSVDVLNGIAYDTQAKRMFVTGKLWPLLFEIDPVTR